MTATTIAIINQKGGTGKTTSAVNLSAGIARKGYRVLLIDLDPQAHATYGMGIDLDEVNGSPNLSHVFGEECMPLQRVLIETAEPNLKLAPSDIRLAKAATLLHTRNFRETLLQKAIGSLTGFDYIILDCQPSLDVLSVNALVAANRVIVPTQLAGHALRGLADLLVTIQSVKESDDYDWRVLLTMVGGHSEERQQQAVKILSPLEDHILSTRIRRTEAIERSQMETEKDDITPVIRHRHWNRGAKDYRTLVKEVLKLWPVS